MSLWLLYHGSVKTNNGTAEQWWTSLSSGEKDFIRALMRMVQSAKDSQVIEVARAARKWESGLTFFFKVRLKNQRSGRFAARHGDRRIEKNNENPHRTISYQSNARSQQGVSPDWG